MLIRSIAWFTAAVALTSCTGKSDPESFQGDPLIASADPNAVVHTIDDSDYPAVLLTAEKGAVGIGIFQSRTGSPAVTLRDADNDGVFDLLTYSALSESGENLVDVEDYGMDGQPDFILDHKAQSARVFVNGMWHEVDGVGTQSVTVDIEGNEFSLDEVLTALGRAD